MAKGSLKVTMSQVGDRRKVQCRSKVVGTAVRKAVGSQVLWEPTAQGWILRFTVGCGADCTGLETEVYCRRNEMSNKSFLNVAFFMLCV